MGVITVITKGSFPKRAQHNETALEGGHAAAIGRTIEYLTEMLPRAIELDHRLHDGGECPTGSLKHDDMISPGRHKLLACVKCGRADFDTPNELIIHFETCSTAGMDR